MIIYAERLAILLTCAVTLVWAACALVWFLLAQRKPKTPTPFDWSEYEDLRYAPPTGFKLVDGKSA